MKLRLIGVTGVLAAVMCVPAVTTPAAAMLPPDDGPTLSAVRQAIVTRAWNNLNNPRKYRLVAGGTIYSSTPVPYDHNLLGTTTSNANRNQYNAYNGEPWCGSFAAAMWTGVMVPSTSTYPFVPANYASSQAWRQASRYRGFNTSAGKTLPRPGDVLVWQDGSGTAGVSNGSSTGHVGVVVATYQSTVYTIEGNVNPSSDSIAEGNYAWDSNGPTKYGKHFMGYVSRE